MLTSSSQEPKRGCSTEKNTHPKHSGAVCKSDVMDQTLPAAKCLHLRIDAKGYFQTKLLWFLSMLKLKRRKHANNSKPSQNRPWCKGCSGKCRMGTRGFSSILFILSWEGCAAETVTASDLCRPGRDTQIPTPVLFLTARILFRMRRTFKSRLSKRSKGY